MKVSIDDIAREANVSKMTVSRVVNDSRYVSPKTREKVQKIIEKRGYNVNILAKNLSRGKGLDVVGVITGIESLFGKYYFVELIRQIEKYLEDKGHTLFIFNLLEVDKIEQSKKKLDILCDYYHSKVIKGFIMLAPAHDDKRIKFLSSNKVKGIVIGSRIDDKNFGYIDVNNFEGVDKAVTHLVENGHQKIAIIKGAPTMSASIERERAFFEIMKKHKLSVDEDYITSGFFTRKGGSLAARKLFSLKQPPTAIFVANDDMALGVYDEAEVFNLKIPDDISVVGFDNIDIASDLEPPLTTIAQPFETMGEMAALCLIKEEFNIKTEVSPIIIERDSVRKR